MGLGATLCVDPSTDYVGARVREEPDGICADYAFEAVGSGPLVEACLMATRNGGTTVMVGAPPIDHGVALNPATPANALAHVLDLVDLVLVMTVNPGFGGQQYIASMEPKIAEVLEMIRGSGLDEQVDVEVDGGVGPEAVAAAAAAGANVLVAGSALYRDPLGLAHAVTDLRARATAALP